MTDDQKRLLGIGGISLLALFALTRRNRTATGPIGVPVSSQGSTQPYTPQAPLPLQPGESVYDPNSEALLTTPTGFPPAPQAAAQAAPGYVVNVSYPQPAAAKKPTPVKPKPAPRKVNAKKPKSVIKSTTAKAKHG